MNGLKACARTCVRRFAKYQSLNRNLFSAWQIGISHFFSSPLHLIWIAGKVLRSLYDFCACDYRYFKFLKRIWLFDFFLCFFLSRGIRMIVETILRMLFCAFADFSGYQIDSLHCQLCALYLAFDNNIKGAELCTQKKKRIFRSDSFENWVFFSVWCRVLDCGPTCVAQTNTFVLSQIRLSWIKTGCCASARTPMTFHEIRD